MEQIINVVKNNPYHLIGNSTTKDDIANRLILLQALEYAPPPLEYLQFLIQVNGIHSFDANLYGCYDFSDDIFTDFLDKNLLLDRTDKRGIMLLGENTMDYLVYNNKDKSYETRDKQTDEITFTFDNLKDALSYFFDLEEE